MSNLSKTINIWPSSFYPVVGGVQTVSLEIAKYLKENNWKVQIITNRYPITLKSVESKDGLDIKRFLFLHSPINYIKSGRFDLLLVWFFLKPINLLCLYFFFLKNKPEIVHIHFPENQIFEALVMQKLFRFKSIISFHGNDIEKVNSISMRSLKYKFIQSLLKEASMVTGCSDFVLNQIKKKFPFIEEKTNMSLYNGVSAPFLTKDVNAIRNENIFIAARNEPVKGIDLIKNLKLQNSILIAGSGYSEKQLISNVIIMGELTSNEIADHLYRCKIAVIPSKREAFGIVVAEALCCGSPVVATNVGGIPEVIALATENLNNQERVVFNQWVKLVSPTSEAISKGINSIITEKTPIINYLSLVQKIRSQFYWNRLLNDYHYALKKLV